MPYKNNEARRLAEANPVRRNKRRKKDRERYAKNPMHYTKKRRTWAQNNPDRNKELSADHRLNQRYGISAEDRLRMYVQQRGRCANHGCDNPLKTDRTPFGCVDHDHTTGKVRGLLCWGCNVVLGHVRDSIPILYGLIEYLRRAHGGCQTP